MRIKVTRQQAIDALLQGRCVWFGPTEAPSWANGYELGNLNVSRRKAASWPNHFRDLSPKGTKHSWWIDEQEVEV